MLYSFSADRNRPLSDRADNASTTRVQNLARTEPVGVALCAPPVLLAERGRELLPGDAGVAGELVHEW